MRLFSIIAIITLLSLPGLVNAQTDTVYINEVIIRDNQPSIYQMEGNRVVQIITQQQIKDLPARSLNELLEIAINADIRQRGADEVQADVSLRGGSFEQTLILLNGVRVNDPQTGHHNLDLPVELSQIDRIEILEGSGTRQYGANAFCGIINIVTDDADNSFLRVGVMAGMYQMYEGVLSGGFTTKKTSNFLSLSNRSSGGYTNNTDYDIWKGYYSGNFYTSSGTYNLQLGGSDKAFGANSFYSAKYPNQYEHTKTIFSSLQYTSSGKVKVTPQMYWRRHHDRFELFRHEPPAWYKNHNYHLTDVLGGSLNIQFNSVLGKTGIKAEYFYDKILSNVLGKTLNDTVSDMLDKSGFFTKSAHRNNISLSLEHLFTESEFSFSVGALINYNDVFGYDFSPGIDLSYAFKPSIKWYFAANKSFRLPTYTDLYYQGPTNKGNPELKPEKAYSAETGFKFLHRGFFAHIAGFYRIGTNIIDWVKLPDSVKWESANITELQTWGIETSARLDLNKYNVKKCPVTSMDIAYSYIISNKNSGEYISYYLMDYLKHKFNLGINLKIYKKIGLSLVFSYSDRNGTYTNIADGKETDYKAFTTTDMKLYWRPLNFDIYVNCNNLFDARYHDFGNIEMPGRWIFGGVNYKLDFSKKSRKND